MIFTAREIAMIFEALETKYGRGWSDDREVGALQAKLSILGEVAAARQTTTAGPKAAGKGVRPHHG